MADEILQREIDTENNDAVKNGREPWTKEQFLDGTYDEYIYKNFGYIQNPAFSVTVSCVDVLDTKP